jgi:hypothetical protein
LLAYSCKRRHFKKILNHLGLWDVKRKVPPKAHGPPIEAFILDDNSPIPCVEDYLIDALNARLKPTFKKSCCR